MAGETTHMNEDRRLRYRDKLLWIHNRSSLIETWTGEKEMQDYPDQKTTLAIFQAFHEIAEAFMDLIAMMLRDMDIPARDDYSNIDKISLFSPEQKDILRGMNGLRNRIIHRYNGTDEHQALLGISEVLTEIPALTRACEEWLNTS